MAYWLIKSEPDIFSIDDLKGQGAPGTPWDGVRNYQARNMLRDAMRIGDGILYYHSNCAEPGIVGLAEVASAAYPDPTACDPSSAYYDPKGDPQRPRWYLVDVRYVRHLRRALSLAELKTHADGPLAELALVRRGNRLSVMPVTPEQWAFILRLESTLPP
jgi:predicted RNA-binding protein with PUA-like domain